MAKIKSMTVINVGDDVKELELSYNINNTIHHIFTLEKFINF